jgi:RNA recognition motif-containing protein
MKGQNLFNSILVVEHSMNEQFKVFVGNLPYTFTEEELKQAFMTVGGFTEQDITEVIILKEKSQDPSRPPRSRGIGFVGFTNAELMQAAIEKVNAAEVEYTQRGETMKRPIFVNEARPFVPREERSNGGDQY